MIFTLLAKLYWCFVICRSSVAVFVIEVLFGALKAPERETLLQFGLPGAFLRSSGASWDVLGILVLAKLQWCFVICRSSVAVFVVAVLFRVRKVPKRETQQFDLPGVFLRSSWASRDVFDILVLAKL